MTPNKKIGVLLVDDSGVYRQFLRDALGDDPRIEIVSIASNGRLALPRVRHYHPDFVILDHEMPEMNGIETLKEIRRIDPDVKVIMFSSYTTEGAKITIEALKEGATDFVTKPHGGGENPVDYIRRKLLPRLIELAGIMPLERRPRVTAPAPVLPPPADALPGAFDVAAIGISTGGPVALKKLFLSLPKTLRGSLLIVQHMPPVFTKHLAESLQTESGIPTHEGEAGQPIVPGHAYIAPGGLHMGVVRKEQQVFLELLDTDPVNSCKPSADVLFESVADVFGRKGIGIIMTGMGQDGYQGLRRMREKGCYLMAQNRETCLVYGMPSRPVEEGLVQEALGVEQIAERIRYLIGD